MKLNEPEPFNNRKKITENFCLASLWHPQNYIEVTSLSVDAFSCILMQENMKNYLFLAGTNGHVCKNFQPAKWNPMEK